ncbi:MAG: proline dehydrogenase family protein [Chloroflexota bacterium]|nr:proline dehydrogenase family protein [Chloroflexota bacterium]
MAILDLLGESVTDAETARSSAESYLRLLEEIRQRNVESHVSLKLTQLGMDVDEELCSENVERIIRRACDYGIFVRIDMESSAYTQRTLDLFRDLRRRYDNCGVVIQSYLYRSAQDVEDLIAMRARVRLCKGAYLEPPEVAYQTKGEVDANFKRLAERLLAEGNYPALATHDPAMIEHARKYAAVHKIPPSRFEFQMLYGVRRDLQESLAAEGYNVRCYIPFGTEWYPYFMRRLAERPANIMFVLRNLIRERRPQRAAPSTSGS